MSSQTRIGVITLTAIIGSFAGSTVSAGDPPRGAGRSRKDDPRGAAAAATDRAPRRLTEAMDKLSAARSRRPRDFSDIASVAGTLCTQPAANCQAPDNFDALTSDQQFYLIADDFSPTTTGNITSICWRGAYAASSPGGYVDCQGTTPDSYTIRYYNNNGGVPGTLIGSFTQSQGTLAVSGPVATGAQVAGQVPEYELTATHAAVSVTAGQCYWVEISNRLTTTCVWFWEIGVPGNGWSMQDGDGNNPPNGYTADDVSGNDFAFCLNRPLGNSVPCSPAGPSNNDCLNATAITGEGTFLFDNRLSRTEATRVPDCYPSVDTRLDGDVWYCWTASCSGTVLVSSCDLADEDTMIAVYNGCGACPPSNAQLLQCNDDRCGPDQSVQSMAVFEAVQGQQYLLRVGTFPENPRGQGAFSIACGPPDNAACGVAGSGDCCTDTGTPGCEDEACCELVCACDTFCCDTTWDGECAALGFRGSGCGAELLCPEVCAICGNPSAGDCCQESAGRGCNNAECCEAVCSCDSFCCDNQWDESCATFGLDNNGCGARVLCEGLCGGAACPTGTVQFLDPPSGVVDARQPHSPTNVNDRMGLRAFRVQAPAGAENIACWSLCESAVQGPANDIQSVVSNGDGTVTVTLTRIITVAAVTTISYTDDSQVSTTGRFRFHPGNVNADGTANVDDVVAILAILRQTVSPPFGLYSADLDVSGSITSRDLLRLADLFNGGDVFTVWLGMPLPTGCP